MLTSPHHVCVVVVVGQNIRASPVKINLRIPAEGSVELVLFGALNLPVGNLLWGHDTTQGNSSKVESPHLIRCQENHWRDPVFMTPDGELDHSCGEDYTLGKILYSEGGEAQEDVAQRSYGCLIPGSVQGQVRWDTEQCDLVEGVPVQGRGVERDDLQDSFQAKQFYESMKSH
ncbi:hypothetical protein WISP_124573 [Willisornis vidua]|uniref:Uncharacterized protein n=1 Tax=Willisornis vidua TaxID=1566151 RepID=A0ABQ9CRK1_9PASS|nr:hypothetical protein WISP_124573 [Willisornis vidua]